MRLALMLTLVCAVFVGSVRADDGFVTVLNGKDLSGCAT